MSKYLFFLCSLFTSNSIFSQSLVENFDRIKIDQQNLHASLNSREKIKNITLSNNPIFQFQIEENNVIDGPFAEENPDVKTFYIVKQGKITGSFTFSSHGIWANYQVQGKSISISPDWNSHPNDRFHKVKYGHKPNMQSLCGVNERGQPIDFATFRKIKNTRADFSQKTEYRIAVLGTGEFTLANGGTVTSARAAIAASVNGISEFFLTQLGYELNLIGSQAFPNPATDPFIPDNSGGLGRTVQAGTQVPLLINSSTFDIGHVVHTHKDDDGWSNGGLAQLRSVCNNNVNAGQLSKASGWSGAYSNDDFGWLSLFAHEVGHQFGMTHTFNGEGESCQDAISNNTAVEIGSGTTIMSYNGLCQPDNNVPANGELDGYFHFVSFAQAYAYIQSLEDAGVACRTPANTTNFNPEAVANPCNVSVYNLPRSTPFYLKAEATDQDGDVIYHAWEQTDEDGAGTPTQGAIGTAAGNSNQNAPLFKNIPPSIINERYFPDVLTVSQGNNSDVFQALPNRQRKINFAYSARDNKSTGGGIDYETFEINVAATGPLTILTPNTNVIIVPGTNFDVTWNTNGSDALCTNARIRLSTDGGLSFPIILAEGVDYAAGTQSVSLPKSLNISNSARIKIECADYDCYTFYDISNVNFRIQSDCNAPKSIVCPSNNLSFNKGDAGLDLNLEHKSGLKISTLTKALINTPGTGSDVIVYNTAKTGCANIANYFRNSAIISVDKSGVYTFSVDLTNPAGRGFITIVNNEIWNPSFPCADGFIGSSAYDSGSSSIINEGFVTVNLQECVDYRILFYSFTSTFPFNVDIENINGPGNVIEHYTTTQTANYSYTYIAVRNSDQIIVAASPTADFRSLNGGLYTIYGLNYKSSGPTPPNNTDINNYIGQEFINFFVDGDCFDYSYNNFELEVVNECSITNIEITSQGGCNPENNEFTQNFIVTYDGTPIGKIIAGDDEANITGSPQTVTIIDIADGQQKSVDLYLESEPDCRFTLEYTAPPGCCPFEIGIDENVTGCTGQPLTLVSNGNLGTYEWTNEAGVVLSTTNEVSVTSNGKYFIEITSPTGCAKKQEVNVLFEQTPSISLPADVTICNGVDFQINATTTSGNIAWYKNDTLLQSGSLKILEVNSAGIYSAVVGTGLCEALDVINVSTKPSPLPNLGADKNLCEGSNIELEVANEGTIQWFFNNIIISGEDGTSIIAEEEGNYKVIVSGSNGCANEDQVSVRIFELPVVDAGEDKEFCSGKSVQIIASAIALDFQWYRNDQQVGQPNLTFDVSLPGEYKIEAVNEIGCTVSDSITVTENPLPVADLGADIIACIGSDVVLENSVTNGLTFQWIRNGTVIGTGNDITVNAPSSYSVQVTDNNGCSAIDNIIVDFQQGPSVLLNEINVEICEGESFEIIATTTATKIAWERNGITIAGQTSKNLTVNQAGNYTIKATGSLQGGAECTAEQDFNVKVNPKLALSLNDTTACEGENIVLTSNVTAPKYTWYFNDEVVGFGKSFTPTTAGVYTIEVETNEKCVSSDEVNVVFSQRPGVGLDPTGEFCAGDDLNIIAQSNGNAFKWFRNNIVQPNETNKSITVTTAGTYIFEASFDGACPKRDTIIVTQRPTPNVSLGENTTICPGQNVTLNALNNGAKYNWSTGDTTQTIVINNTGNVTQTRTIIVEVTNQFNCASSDEIDITLRPKVLAEVEASATGICNGDTVTLTANGGLNYVWSGPSATFSFIDDATILVFPKENSTYTLIASDDCPGNRDTVIREVKFFTLKPATAGNDTCVITGRSIKLKASGGIRYLWEDDVTITAGINTSTPTIAPIIETTYVVTITDNNGCEQIDSIAVCIIEDPLTLIKPVEYITPNDDGFNDDLIFEGLEGFPDNSLFIYNRWGNVVFEKFRYQQDSDLFDGTRNGEPLPPDTYYYVLKFDQYTFKSALTIVREK